MSNGQCKKAYIDIQETMICAGDKGHAICKGDSGGPLIDAQTKALIGIVSASSPRDCVKKPGIYTRVSGYIDWIKQNSGGNPGGDPGGDPGGNPGGNPGGLPVGLGLPGGLPGSL